MVLFFSAAVLVLSLALLSKFHGFKIYDDAYMFVRYADHLVAGQGMVWNPGEGKVYGATSLAYVVALIPFRMAFPDNPAAALFSCSFFWGLVFVGISFWMALKTMRPDKAMKPWRAGFVFLALIAAAVSLRTHFASGMETTLVMSYLGLCLILWEGMGTGGGNPWLAGIMGGCAWWVRPDLLVFSLGIPGLMAILSPAGGSRRQWIRALLVTVGVGLWAMGGARMLTGAWLPLSFFAKNTGLYGPEFAATYRWLPLHESARFMARTWPSLLLVGMGVYLKWPRLGRAYRALDKAIMAAMVVYAVYFTFFVLQVMGFGQRFYFPLLPILIHLGLRELREMPETLRTGRGIPSQAILHQRIGMLCLAGFLAYHGVDYGRSLRQACLDRRIAVFSAMATYRAELTDYWARLDALQGLPDAMGIATTEVGMPSALYPNRRIYDLAGLNAPGLVADGLGSESVLRYCPADLMYLPHEDYRQLVASLQSSPEFAARYETIPGTRLKAAMGVAIRRDSPFAADLRRIFEPWAD
ncbi:MAG: hypothetical protein RLZZ165_2247 [Bacteroidota bacterium]